MLTYRDLYVVFRKLGLDCTRPVIVHCSLSAFGEVHGGAEAMVGALLSVWERVVMPIFTYKTMILPESGPPDNGITYGSGENSNRMAEFFTPDMPADRMMGAVPEALRQHPKASRSSHPILSFSGVNAGPILQTQTLAEPLAPLGMLHAEQGWVLLLGVDHTANTTIHYAERWSRRKQFVRWALTPTGVVECPSFPGCSDGFNVITPLLEQDTRLAKVGDALVQAVPIPRLVEAVRELIARDPLALLCNRPDCERCNEVRASSSQNGTRGEESRDMGIS